jgi:hypothetical protein
VRRFLILLNWELVGHQHHTANQLQIATTRHADALYFGAALVCTLIQNGKEQESRRRSLRKSVSDQTLARNSRTIFLAIVVFVRALPGKKWRGRGRSGGKDDGCRPFPGFRRMGQPGQAAKHLETDCSSFARCMVAPFFLVRMKGQGKDDEILGEFAGGPIFSADWNAFQRSRRGDAPGLLEERRPFRLIPSLRLAFPRGMAIAKQDARIARLQGFFSPAPRLTYVYVIGGGSKHWAVYVFLRPRLIPVREGLACSESIPTVLLVAEVSRNCHGFLATAS